MCATTPSHPPVFCEKPGSEIRPRCVRVLSFKCDTVRPILRVQTGSISGFDTAHTASIVRHCSMQYNTHGNTPPLRTNIGATVVFSRMGKVQTPSDESMERSRLLQVFPKAPFWLCVLSPYHTPLVCEKNSSQGVRCVVLRVVW